MSRVEPGWDRQPWLDIGRVLLDAEGRTLTAPGIAAALQAHPSNVKRHADAMVEAGLLEQRDPGKRAPGMRGPAPTAAFFLPAASAASVRARAGESMSPGLVLT